MTFPARDLFNAPKPPSTDPRDRQCRACTRFGSCLIGEAAFCVEHAPADFWPGRRA